MAKKNSNEPEGTETADKTGGSTSDALSVGNDHDRVAMLSLRADGTPDQTNPEVIVDEEDPRLKGDRK